MLGVPLVMVGGLVSLIVVNNRARARAHGPSGSGDAGEPRPPPGDDAGPPLDVAP